MSSRLQVEFAGVPFKNPVVMASGTFGFGREYAELFDIEKLGGISSKGLTLNPRSGNEGIRIWETPSGIMNSVGLENPGVEGFIQKDLDWVNSLDLVNVVNVGGHSIEDYVQAVERLNDVHLDLLELNISCPNVKQGGMNFGVKTELAAEVVRTIRKVCKHKLVVKMSPNAENIVDLAKACEAEGADGLSLVNTFLGMAIDINKRKPVFNNGYAGVSGPAIKPIALNMIYQVRQSLPDIPIIGMGGISTVDDVMDFISVGCDAVAIGTANFTDPYVCPTIIEDLAKRIDSLDLNHIHDIKGRAYRS